MKIALVSAFFPTVLGDTGTVGGIETHSYHIAHELCKKGVEVTVFCGGRRESITSLSDGVEVIRLPFRFSFVPPNFLWFQLENYSRFRDYLDDFDIVHSEHSSGTIFPFLRKRIPWVVTFHGSWSTTQRNMIAKSPSSWNFSDFVTYTLGFSVFHAVTQWELTHANQVIACSHSLAQELLRDYSLRVADIEVVENGVDYASLAAIHARAKEHFPLTIYTSGRLFRAKGTHYLLKAAAMLNQEGMQFALKIFGKGPLLSEIRSLIDHFNLSQKVTLVGYVEYDQLMRELVESDIAVFPSLYEAQSMAMLEAMALGKPVVAFDLPFARDIIKHGLTGLLAKPLDSRDLAKNISKLLRDGRLRTSLGRNAQSYIIRKHDWSKIAEKQIEIYSNVLKRSGSRAD